MVDFHKKPFDEGTITKLTLFQDYARSWLPVFLSPIYSGSTVTLVDFFAGPGKDSLGREGSPLRLLRKIREYTTYVRDNRISVRLELNEAGKQKARLLRETMEKQAIPVDLLEWQVHDLPFPNAFDEIYPRLLRGNNLLFFDQQGMKFISDEILDRVTKLERTDFIFFIASSYIRRFRSHPHFKRHLSIPKEISTRAFTDTHRAVTEYYRRIVPEERGVLLAPFSIKKGSNLYGVIFGSSHSLGMEKFLRICWDMDKERGEANFDIDGDSIDRRTPRLFSEMDRAKKLESFEVEIRERILSRRLRSDGDVYVDCLSNGMLPIHGRAVVRELIKSGAVRVAGGLQPRVSKDGRKGPRALEVVANGDV